MRSPAQIYDVILLWYILEKNKNEIRKYITEIQPPNGSWYIHKINEWSHLDRLVPVSAKRPQVGIVSTQRLINSNWLIGRPTLSTSDQLQHMTIRNRYRFNVNIQYIMLAAYVSSVSKFELRKIVHWGYEIFSNKFSTIIIFSKISFLYTAHRYTTT